MADPLPLYEIYDRLPIATVEWDIQRLDEIAITGAGEESQAELAEPLWRAPVTLGIGKHSELKQAAALIRSLRGSQQPFMMCDPTSLWPQADRGGVILGASAVTIRTAPTSRAIAPLTGLPAGYVLTPGDKMQLAYGSPVRCAFVEVSRLVAANASGDVNVPVFPWLPMALPAGATVTLVRAACPVIIEAGSHRPGVARRSITEGAAFTAVQKR